MSIFEYNGAAIVAMAGNNCVGIGCDKRLGSNQLQTVSADFPKVFPMNDRTLVGFAGLATDVQTAHSHLRYQMNLYKLREERDMRPSVVSNLVSTMLYGRRFAPWFITPVVAGLDDNSKPVICGYDFLGCATRPGDFIVAGTSSQQLFGVCESFWKPDMNEDELFETLSQCLMAGIDRDCLAGWGATVYILTPDKLTTKTLKTRAD